MVAEIDADSCWTVELTVDVFVVLMSSNVIHKKTVTKVKTEIRKRSRSLFGFIIGCEIYDCFYRCRLC